ncbi:hypothetical protein EB796_014438 [Bugula neritina]|uniref:Uncharacterized protein n=1 Tax=Bugula neritina TaxID=10212 RepID=A0A7J7JLM1_BUGNE|nr:hypothetical protein EB796_014438 [Bugula neritina]
MAKRQVLDRKSKAAAPLAVKTEDKLASRRPKRAPKVIFDPITFEEDAQLKIAIHLSLKAQKETEEDAKSCAIKKDTVPATKNLIAEQKPSVSDSSGVGNTNKPQRKRQNSSSSKSRSKKIKTENTQSINVKTEPIENCSTDTCPRIPAKKVKVEKLEKAKTESADIPSTTSFINYILEKHSSNKNMKLAKLFQHFDSETPLVNPQTSSSPLTVDDKSS